MRERIYCCACKDWQPVEYNVYRDDMPSCYVCGSDEIEFEHEHEGEPPCNQTLTMKTKHTTTQRSN